MEIHNKLHRSISRTKNVATGRQRQAYRKVNSEKSPKVEFWYLNSALRYFVFLEETIKYLLTSYLLWPTYTEVPSSKTNIFWSWEIFGGISVPIKKILLMIGKLIILCLGLRIIFSSTILPIGFLLYVKIFNFAWRAL